MISLSGKPAEESNIYPEGLADQTQRPLEGDFQQQCAACLIKN
jgi:hypothetical protein